MVPVIITMICCICHKSFKINVNEEGVYSSQVVRDNCVCTHCARITKRIRIVLKCKVCSKEFQTKVLIGNIGKYSDFTCPACIKPKDQRDHRCKNKEFNCDACKVKSGVCFKPELSCTLSAGFILFDGSNLYSIKKENTLLAVDKVDVGREDIHALHYTMLYGPRYLLSKNSVVVMKQRTGSKKGFVTNVVIYGHKPRTKQFVVLSDINYERGNNWIPPTRDQIAVMFKANIERRI